MKNKDVGFRFLKLLIDKKKDIPSMFRSASLSNIHAKLIEIAHRIEKDVEVKPGFVIHGPPGVGKTYALYAIHIYLENCENPINSIVIPYDQIAEAIKDTYRKPMDEEDSEEISDSYDFLEDLGRFKGLLLIDDLCSTKTTNSVIDRLFEIINKRYVNELPMSFTTNLDPDQLRMEIGDRNMSRISHMCELLELNGGDRRI